ncbi:DMT family transporter [Photobacterium japonica]|uniref:DMT family transporter n=1 Tax=Photobacterium japonica TaxID=2910235 RepID=UPI003D0BCAF6
MLEKQKGWIAAIFIGFLWGTPWVVGTPLMEVMDSKMLVWLRYVVASITLFVILQVMRKSIAAEGYKKFSYSWDNRVDVVKTFACGFIGQALFSYFAFLSLDYITASENGVIMGLIPIQILAVGFVTRGERFTLMQVGAACLAFAGVTMLVYDPALNSDGFSIGHLIAFMSAFAFASTAYTRADLAKKYGSISTMYHQFIFAAVGFTFVVMFYGLDFTTALGAFTAPSRILSIFILGVFISGISYLIYIYGITKVGVDGTGMALNLMPLASFVLAAVVLSEPVTLWKCAAIAIVVAALMVFVKATANRNKAAAAQQAVNATVATDMAN